MFYIDMYFALMFLRPFNTTVLTSSTVQYRYSNCNSMLSCLRVLPAGPWSVVTHLQSRTTEF